MLTIPRVRTWPILLFVVLATALFGGVGAVLAIDSSSEGRSGVLSVDDAEATVELLAERATELDAEVIEVRAELADLEARTAELGADRAALVDEIEQLVRQNRELVVSAFITGGEAQSLRLLGSDRAADYQWQTYLLSSESVQAGGLAAQLEAITAAADAELVELAARLDSRRNYLAVAEARLGRLRADVADAELELVVAEAWALSDRAVERGRHGEAPAEAWARLRSCESSGDYRAVDPSGAYRGAYQFDRQTWRTVGGMGDPINATPREQDARARALYALRGNQPWPVCGHHLP